MDVASSQKVNLETVLAHQKTAVESSKIMKRVSIYEKLVLKVPSM